MPTSVRDSIEKASRPLLGRLSSLHPTVPFAALLALLLVGALIGGPVGLVLIGVAAGFVAWLLYLSWPRLSGAERLMRIAVLLLAVVMAVTQVFPRG